MKEVQILNNMFPDYLRNHYQSLQSKDHSDLAKVVGAYNIKDMEHYKVMRNKIHEWHRAVRENILKHSSLQHIKQFSESFEAISWLQKPKNTLTYLSAPASGPAVDKKDTCTFGSFIPHNSLPYLKLKKKVMDEVVKMFPNLENSLSKLLTLSRLTADNPDLPALSVIDTRREIGLDDGPLTKDEQDMLNLYMGILLDDWTPELIESAKWLKKDSGLGFINYVVSENEFICDKVTMNKPDGHAIMKNYQFNKFMKHITLIKEKLWNGDFSGLFKELDILFQSRLIKRDQADSSGKERHNVYVDSYFTGTLVFVKADLHANMHLLKKLDKDEYGGDVYKFAVENNFQGVRVRATYGAEYYSMCYPIATTQSMRSHYKNAYPKVFKFGSDDYLLKIVNDARKEIHKLTGENVELIAIDNIRFDHTPKLGYLATIFNKIAEKDQLTGLLLAIQAISPIAIGNAGYSKLRRAKVENIMLGNPLDINTFFFGQGKSGDPDVADRCKFLCSWNLVVVILKALSLEYNKNNILALLNHELPIAFLNLGDNNLILVPTSYKDKLKQELANSSILKASIEEDAIFGGKLFKIESDHSISIEKSPVSLLDKLLTPEEPFGLKGKITDTTVRRKGWSTGMRMRHLEAEEQLQKYGKDSSKIILDLLDKLWVTELGSSSLSDLARYYEPKFRRHEESESKLYQALYNSNDWQAKYLLLDADSIYYKVDIDELSDDIRQVYFESIGSRIKEDTTMMINNQLGGKL